MAKTAISERMENTPIPQLIFKSSVPLMISTLASSMYGLVDSMFVSRISEKALTATTIAFPITLVLYAITIGTAMGVNSRMSRFLGEGEISDARETGWTGIVLAVFSCIPFMLIGAVGLPFIFPLLTTDVEISAMGQVYSQITLLFCIGQFFASMGARLLQATGNASLSMATQLTGTVLNCVLDPIMIFGWLGFPAMGIRGAAIATVLSQCVSGGLATALYFVKNPSLRLHRQDLRVRFDLAGEIYHVAVPTMVTMALNSILLMVTNRILQNISNTVIAFYGVFSKLQNFMFMPVNGLSQGIVPVIGYFYGAKNGEKIRSAVSFALKLGVGVMAVGSVIFCLFPTLLMSLYAPSQEMLAIGRVGLRLLAISFVPLAFVLIFGNVFTAMGNGLVNMRCSMVRGILPIPLLLLLIRFTGTSWCWLAFVLSDCIAAVYAIQCYQKIRHSQKLS